MKVDRERATAALSAGAAVVEVDGREYRRREKLPEDAREGVLLRDEKGHLTRAGMEKVIREGGGVMTRDGEVLTSVDQLPDEADLVRGNEAAERQLADSLDAQIAALSAQRGKLLAATRDEGGGQQSSTAVTVEQGKLQPVPQPPPMPASQQERDVRERAEKEREAKGKKG